MDDIKEPVTRARRMGRINIITSIVDADIGWDVMHQLSFMPWHVVYNAQEEQVEMLGTSPLFRWVPEGQPAPVYDITLHYLTEFEIEFMEGVPGSNMMQVVVTEQPAPGKSVADLAIAAVNGVKTGG